MRRVAAVVLAAVLVGACSGSDAGEPASPATSQSTAASTSTAPARGDLEVLAEQIVAVHPDPFLHRDRDAFEAAVVDDPDDPDRLLVAAMRLANLGTGDGHGGIYPWAQPALEAWPLHLFEFDDGLRVVGGTGVESGSRLVAVGATPVEEVVDAVRPLVPHDNEWTVRARLPAYLVFPAVLRGLGFDPSELTWERLDGSRTTAPPPEPITAEAFGELLGLFQAQVPPTLPYDRDRIFWSERRGEVLYVRWNQVQPRDGATTLSDLATAMVEEVTSEAVARVVIDVRHNPGGESRTATPLVLAVTEIEQARPGTVRFLVGRGTFSAASMAVSGLQADLGVLLVGEPTGGSARAFGDPRPVDLPSSGLVAFVDTGEYRTGDGGWGPLEPDVPVAVTWDDHAAGRDPAYDAAVTATR